MTRAQLPRQCFEPGKSVSAIDGAPGPADQPKSGQRQKYRQVAVSDTESRHALGEPQPQSGQCQEEQHQPGQAEDEIPPGDGFILEPEPTGSGHRLRWSEVRPVSPRNFTRQEAPGGTGTSAR